MKPPPPRSLTRRAVLTGVAGAGAVALLEPVSGLADTLIGHGPVFSRVVGSLVGESPPLRAPRQFSLVGVEWSGPSAVRIELRARGAEGRWSRWVAASTLGHGPDVVRERCRRFGEPIWTGAARSVQLRASRPVTGVRVHFVDEPTSSGATAAAALPLATPVLDAGSRQPPIVARAAWAQGGARPSVPAAYGNVRLAFVHHTVSPNGYAQQDVPSILRSIFVYHRYVRGYDDIAYNFMIDAFGGIWEARAGGIDLPVIGAQAGGYNAVSTGVAMIGTFMSAVPPAVAIAALERLLAWKLSLHGLPTRGHVTVEVNPADAFYTPFAPGAHVSLPRIAGHRDGDSTDCPGDALYSRLPAIRARAAALATTPARVTLLAPEAPVLAGASIGLSGRLATLAAQPVAGAPIELQQIGPGRERTFETVTTGADGTWSAATALSHNTIVRALHRPQPATASDLLAVSVAPVITLAVQSLAPLRVTGVLTPQKRNVTIDAYQLQGGHRRLASSKQVSTRAGRFTAGLTIRRSGQYLLIARTKADARNAAGTSAPVRVAV